MSNKGLRVHEKINEFTIMQWTGDNKEELRKEFKKDGILLRAYNERYNEDTGNIETINVKRKVPEHIKTSLYAFYEKESAFLTEIPLGYQIFNYVGFSPYRVGVCQNGFLDDQLVKTANPLRVYLKKHACLAAQWTGHNLCQLREIFEWFAFRFTVPTEPNYIKQHPFSIDAHAGSIHGMHRVRVDMGDYIICEIDSRCFSRLLSKEEFEKEYTEG